MTNQRNLGQFGVPVIFVLIVATAIGFVTLNRQQPTVQIGVVLPLEIGIGQQMLQAIELAHANWQPTSDIQVEILARSFTDNEEVDIMARHNEHIQEFIANDDILAVIGATNTPFAIDVLADTNTAYLPVLSPAATWPGLTKSGYRAGEPGIYYPTGNRHFFRTIPADDIQGLAALEWMSRLNVTDVYVLTNVDNPYSSGLGGILVANAGDYGINVITSENFSLVENYEDAEEVTEAYNAIAERIAASNAQVVYIPVPSSIGAYDILLNIFALNPDIIVFGSEGLPAEENILAELDSSSQVYATSLTPDVEHLEAAQTFITQFEATYGETPGAFTLMSHDAMLAILNAVNATPELSREAILHQLQSLQDVDGAMGTWRFDERGDITLNIVSILQLQNGEWQTKGTVQP